VTLRDEVTELLRALLRLDTVNPPGNETLAATLLQRYLADNGVASELVAKTPDRANLVARLPGGLTVSMRMSARRSSVASSRRLNRTRPWTAP